MAQTTSDSLGELFETFIGARVAKGRYRSASAVARAGPRLLEEHEARLEAPRGALIEEAESGTPEAFDSDAFLKQTRAEPTP